MQIFNLCKLYMRGNYKKNEFFVNIYINMKGM